MMHNLRDIFYYYPETGELLWKAHGDIGLSAITYKDGVGFVKLHGKVYRAINLIWCWWYGVWPMCELHHVDKDCLNYRIENLAELLSIRVRPCKK